MEKLHAFPLRHLSSILLIFIFCVLDHSVSGQRSLPGYHSKGSANTVSRFPTDKTSTNARLNETNPSSKIQLIKYKIYPSGLNVITVKTIELILRSYGYDKSLRKSKTAKVMKKARNSRKYQPLMNGYLLKGNSIKSPTNDTEIFVNRRNKNKKLLRIRRKAPPKVTESTTVAANDEDEDEDDEGDLIGKSHPTPTPQPNHKEVKEQFAVSKSETGQSQNQQSGVTKSNEKTYNPDGSVKSHNIVSSSTNKQESSQFIRSETTIPIAEAISTDALLGTDASGSRSSFLSGMELPGLPPMAQLPAMAQAILSDPSKEEGSGSETENTSNIMKDRSLGGDDGPPEVRKHSKSRSMGEEDPLTVSKPKDRHGSRNKTAKTKSNSKHRSAGGDDGPPKVHKKSNSRSMGEDAPPGYKRSSSSSRSFSSSSQNSSQSYSDGDDPPPMMTLDSSKTGVRMMMPVQKQFDFKNFHMQPGLFGQYGPMGQGQVVQGQHVQYAQGQPGNFQQGQYGQTVQVYPGHFSQGQPGQFSQGLPGQFRPPGQPGQFSPGFTGQFPSGQPGKNSQGLPGQFSPGMPAQFSFGGFPFG